MLLMLHLEIRIYFDDLTSFNELVRWFVSSFLFVCFKTVCFPLLDREGEICENSSQIINLFMNKTHTHTHARAYIYTFISRSKYVNGNSCG